MGLKRKYNQQIKWLEYSELNKLLYTPSNIFAWLVNHLYFILYIMLHGFEVNEGVWW